MAMYGLHLLMTNVSKYAEKKYLFYKLEFKKSEKFPLIHVDHIFPHWSDNINIVLMRLIISF